MTSDPWLQEINPCLDETEARMLLAIAERACDELGWTDETGKVRYRCRPPWPAVPRRPLSVAESAAVTWLLLDRYIGNQGITERGSAFLRGNQ